MKNIILLMAIGLFVLSACNKDNNDDPQPNTEEWKIGEENETVTKTFNLAAGTNVKITMDDSSLCPNKALGLILEESGNVFLDTTLTAFPQETNFDVPLEAMVKVTTELREGDPLVNCIQLGNVTIKVTF